MERIGWQPRFTLEEGLRKTNQWFKENQELVERYGKATAH